MTGPAEMQRAKVPRMRARNEKTREVNMAEAVRRRGFGASLSESGGRKGGMRGESLTRGEPFIPCFRIWFWLGGGALCRVEKFRRDWIGTKEVLCFFSPWKS